MRGTEKPDDQNQSDDQGDACHNGGCPQNIVQTKPVSDYEKQKNIQRTLVQQGQKEGLDALAHSLKYSDDDKQQRIDGYGNTQDSQEFCAVKDRISVLDEKADELGCEQVRTNAAEQRKTQCAGRGKEHDRFHSGNPVGCVAIRHDGQHALGDTLIHRVGQRIDFPHHADAGHCRAGTHIRDHAVEEEIGDLACGQKKEAGNAAFQNVQRSDADIFSAFQGKAENGISPVAEDIDQKIAHGGKVGNSGGDSRAENLVALGQKQEHKQGIEDHIQHRAQGNAVAGGFGLAGAADQMGEYRRQNGGNAADDHGGVGVLHRVINAGCIAADAQQEGSCAQTKKQGIGCCGNQGAADRDNKCPARPALMSGAHGPCNDAGTADAEKVAECGHDVIHRQAQRDGGNSGGVAGQTHIPGVCQIVDNRNNLADNGGDHHGGHGFGNGIFCENTLFLGYYFGFFLDSFLHNECLRLDIFLHVL